MLLAGLSPAAVEVGVDLRHRGGVVDVGGWMVGIVVVAGSSTQDCRSRFGNSHHISEQTLGEPGEKWERRDGGSASAGSGSQRISSLSNAAIDSSARPRKRESNAPGGE